MDLLYGFQKFQVLFSCSSLGVFEELHNHAGPMTAEAVATRLNLNPAMLGRLMNGAVCINLLKMENTSPQQAARYSNAPVVEQFVLKSSPMSLRPLVNSFGDMYHMFGKLSDTVRKGSCPVPMATSFGIDMDPTMLIQKTMDPANNMPAMKLDNNANPKPEVPSIVLSPVHEANKPEPQQVKRGGGGGEAVNGVNSKKLENGMGMEKKEIMMSGMDMKMEMMMMKKQDNNNMNGGGGMNCKKMEMMMSKKMDMMNGMMGKKMEMMKEMKMDVNGMKKPPMAMFSKMLEFMQTMHMFSNQEAHLISQAVDLSQFSSVCDLGGGTGAIAAHIAERYPQTNVTVLDLPHVISSTEHFIPKKPANLSFKTGDFFKCPLPSADLYILSHVLHDWSIKDIDVLLKRIYNALPRGGSLLVLEKCLNEDKVSPFHTVFFDVGMLLMSDGQERTAAEYRSLLKRHKFSNVMVKFIPKALYRDAILARKDC